MPCQKPAIQPTLRLRVANFADKFPNIGKNSHPLCTQGNRVLVANVDIAMIVDANFALNKVTDTFNVTVTLLKVSAAPYVCNVQN